MPELSLFLHYLFFELDFYSYSMIVLVPVIG